MTDTRIMATVTAVQTADSTVIRQMRRHAMAGVRINSAHVTPDRLKEMIAEIRSIDPEIIILMDTKGPEMRTTDMPEPVSFDEGDTIRIVSDIVDTPSSAECIRVNVPMLQCRLYPGQRLEFDDGAISAVVSVIKDNIIEARIISGGILGPRKTMNAGGFDNRDLPPVSDRDLLNIRAAMEAGVDIIAHSFVRSAADVRAVREAINGSAVKIYAKIECADALENIDGIIRESDGILVARGDLGTAVDPCRIPALQADILARCRNAGRPTVVATQILQSMISSPRPTRAELSDIALAVMEGADWLLLCGETAQGDYPAECVDIMHRTIVETEKYLNRQASDSVIQ